MSWEAVCADRLKLFFGKGRFMKPPGIHLEFQFFSIPAKLRKSA